MSCRTWDRLYAPAHPSIPLNRDPSVHHLSARSGFPQDGDGAHGPKGYTWATWATPHPLPTTVTWDTRAWVFRYILSTPLPPDSGDKNCILPFTGRVLTVRTPIGKTEHLYDSYSSVGCCYPPFVQQLRWQLPSCWLGKESREWKSGLIKPFFSSSPHQVFESWGDDNSCSFLNSYLRAAIQVACSRHNFHKYIENI